MLCYLRTRWFWFDEAVKFVDCGLSMYHITTCVHVYCLFSLVLYLVLEEIRCHFTLIYN